MIDSRLLDSTIPAGKRSARMLLLFVLFLTVSSGCSRQRIYENLYEGIRVNNELQTPPPERGERQNSPDYGQYQNSLRSGKPDVH